MGLRESGGAHGQDVVLALAVALHCFEGLFGALHAQRTRDRDVHHLVDASEGDPTADGQCHVHHQLIAEVPNHAVHKRLVDGQVVGGVLLAVLQGVPLGLAVAVVFIPIADVEVVVFAEIMLRQRRNPGVQSNHAVVDLGDPHPQQLPQPHRELALVVHRRAERRCRSGELRAHHPQPMELLRGAIGDLDTGHASSLAGVAPQYRPKRPQPVQSSP